MLCCAKKGGLVHIRHDGVADEWRHLCGCSLSFRQVEGKPHIFSSSNRTPNKTTGPTETNNTTTLPKPYDTQ